MPLNPSEITFANLLNERAKINPPVAIEELTLEQACTGLQALINEFQGPPAAVEYVEKTVPARDGYAILIRIYHAELTNAPVLFFFPACAYLHDLFEQNAILASHIAKLSGIKVIAVNHRLAPEYPLPTSVQDGYDVVQYVAQHADHFAIDANKIFLAGISSGGNCCAVVSNWARQDNTFSIHHQIPINGWFELTRTVGGYEEYEQQDYCANAYAVAALDKFLLLKDKAIGCNPNISPYYEEDLSHQPRTTFVVAEYDGIRADTEAYYQRLLAADNKNIKKIVLPGQTHNSAFFDKVVTERPSVPEIVADIIKSDLSAK